jgi:hypothetical protein
MSEAIEQKINETERKNLKEKIRRFFAEEFFHSPLIQWIFIGSAFVNIAGWASMAYFIRPVDFPIILHYNVYFGVDIIGSWWQAYFLPAMASFILAVNLVLSYLFFRRKERIASYSLLLGALFVQVGSAIAEISIILINY